MSGPAAPAAPEPVGAESGTAGATPNRGRRRPRRTRRAGAGARFLLFGGALVVVLGLVYGFWLGPHRAAAHRHQQRVAICDVADVIVESGKYPAVEKFVPVEWRYVRAAAGGTGDRQLAQRTQALPVAPDPPAMRSVATYCHAHGLGVVLRQP